MLKTGVRAFVLQQMNLSNMALASDLSQLFDISNYPLCRDLQKLVEEGIINKINGAALSISFDQAEVILPVMNANNLAARFPDDDLTLCLSEKAGLFIKDAYNV